MDDELMARWTFPPDRRFTIHDKDGSYVECELVTEDGDLVTFDFTAASTMQRRRAQIPRDAILLVTYAVDPIEALERDMNRARS